MITQASSEHSICIGVKLEDADLSKKLIDENNISEIILDIKKDKNYKFIKCDISNKKILNILNKYKPSCIFNLAAETHVDRSIDSPKNFIKSNITGVFSLLQVCKFYAKKNKKFITFFKK